MRLSGIKPGDIVRLVDGSHAEVVDKPGGRQLLIRWLGRSTTAADRRVKASEVEIHWSKRRGSST